MSDGHSKDTAGRRRPASRPAKPPSTTFEEWRSNFLGNVRNNRTANKAWRDIQSHQLSAAAVHALHHYAQAVAKTMPHPVLAAARRLTEKADATARAVRVAIARDEDPRAKMFAERAAGQAKELAAQPLLQALAFHQAVRALPIELLPSVSAKSAEAVRRYGGKPYLVMFRDYASKHGIKLSWERIAQLAACADVESRGPVSDDIKRSLLRWLSEPDVQESRPHYLRGFEIYLASRPTK